MKEYVNGKKITAKRVSLNTKSIKIIKNGIIFMKYASIPAIGIAVASAAAIALSDVDTKNNEVEHIDLPGQTIEEPNVIAPTNDIVVVEEISLEEYKNSKINAINVYRYGEHNGNNYNNKITESIFNIKDSFIEAIKNADNKDSVDDFYVRCCENIDLNLELDQTLTTQNQQYVKDHEEELTRFAEQFRNFSFDDYLNLNEEQLRWYKSYENNNFMYYCSETGVQAIEINDIDNNGYESFTLGGAKRDSSSNSNIKICEFDACSVYFHLMPENERRYYDKRTLNPCSYEEMIEMGIELNKGIVK